MNTSSRTADNSRPRPRRSESEPDSAPTEARSVTVRPRGSAVRESAPPPTLTRDLTPDAALVQAEPAEVVEATSIRSWLTLETGLYLLFFALALITRFWDLDVKGLHHDESLHAVFSWKYYTDLGYIHSPMMHGPEQFHLIDIAYLLFGATDATARYASAVCGVILCMAPFFLRRQLGRWPALIATFLILISPALLYHARFAREDSIYATMEMLFVMGLWRFVDERKPRDFYLMCVGYALMFTIKESAYLTTAVVGGLLVALFAWQTGRALFASFIGYVVALGGAALYVLKFSNAPKLPNIPATDPTPDNIRQFVTDLLGHPLIWAVSAVTIIWLAVWGYLLWDQSRRVRLAAQHEAADVADDAPAQTSPAVGVRTRRLNPAVVAERDTTYTVEANGHSDDNGYGEAEATVPGESDGDASEIMAADSVTADDIEAVEGDAEPEGVVVEDAPAPVVKAPARRAAPVRGLLERYQPGSLPYAVGYLLNNPVVLLTGLGAAVLVYVALYTSMFSNINGIGTGMFGSIGYWLAQQDVRRGDQPWFYYMILIPIYEPLILVFGFVGMFYFVGRGFRSWRAHRADPPSREPVVAGATANFKVGQPVEFAEIRPFLVLFLTVWFLGAFGLYSWAGEKMPWLTTHIVHPLVFLAALALGQLITSMIRNRRQRAAMYVAPMDEVEEAPPARSTVATRRGVATRPLGRTVTTVTSPTRLFTSPVSWVPFWSFLGLFLLVNVFWAMAITHRVMNNNYTDWWQLAIFPALLVLLVAAYWSLVGGGRVLRYTLVGILFLLTAYGVRSAIQLAFYHPDTATEMMVYVQSTPDVTRAAATIDRLSIDQTGARDMKVMYDSQTSWPWEWYLRDYKNKTFQPNGPASAPDPTVAVLVLDSAWYDKAKSNQAPQLSNYVGTKYPMRWWFPEDTYRNFIPSTWDELDPQKPKNDDGTPNYAHDSAGKNLKAPVRQIQGALDTIFYTLRSPEEQGKMWKYLIYRQPYAALGSTDMAVFVRKDLVERYNYLASLNLPNYDETMSH